MELKISKAKIIRLGFTWSKSNSKNLFFFSNFNTLL